MNVEKDKEMQAGFNSEIITPEMQNRAKPLQLGGYSPREYATGVHDDLYIRAVYLEGETSDPNTHLLLMVADIIAVDKRMAAIVKRKIATKLGLPITNIMISATHTHHGPDYKGNFRVGGPIAIVGGFFFPKPQTEELKRLGRIIYRCAVKAYTKKQPVQIGIGEAIIPEKDRIMINRRDVLNPSSAQYPISILKFSDRNGNLLGAVLNYAIHGTVLPRQNYLITADYVGYVIKTLEEKFPDLKGNFAYFNGPCGEINPLTSPLKKRLGEISDVSELENDEIYDQQGTWEDAERIGKTIAENAITQLDSIVTSTESPVFAKNFTFNLPIKPYNHGHGFPSVLNRLIYHLKHFLFLNFARLGILKNSILLEADQLKSGHIPAVVQIFTIANLYIVTIPGEFFLKLGNEIRNHIQQIQPDSHSFLIELANNSIGYIYTIEAYEKGGYESSFSLTPMGGRYLTMKIKRTLTTLLKSRSN